MVLPGLVDPHTHIQLDTGIYQTPDDWAVGTRTAACGGVTTVIDFATQFPGQDVRTAVANRLAEAQELANIDYGFHVMLTELPAGDDELEQWMGDLVELGVPSAKVYTTYRPNYYQDDDSLLRVLAAAGRRGVVVMVHAENDAHGQRRHSPADGGRQGQPGLSWPGAARVGRGGGCAAHVAAGQGGQLPALCRPQLGRPLSRAEFTPPGSLARLPGARPARST
ncbi:MAG: amidohydrolase family protein [Anaerolineae bacterium]